MNKSHAIMYFTALIGQSDGEWTSEEMDAAMMLGSLSEAFQNASDWMEKVSTGELNTRSALAILNQLGREEQMECLATCMVTMVKSQTTESELKILREILDNLNQGITEQEVIDHCAWLAIKRIQFDQALAAAEKRAEKNVSNNLRYAPKNTSNNLRYAEKNASSDLRYLALAITNNETKDYGFQWIQKITDNNLKYLALAITNNETKDYGFQWIQKITDDNLKYLALAITNNETKDYGFRWIQKITNDNLKYFALAITNNETKDYGFQWIQKITNNNLKYLALAITNNETKDYGFQWIQKIQ